MRLLDMAVRRLGPVTFVLAAVSCGGGESRPSPKPSLAPPATTLPGPASATPAPATPAPASPTPATPAAVVAPPAPAKPKPAPSRAPSPAARLTTPAPVATPGVDVARVAALVGEAEGALAQGKLTEATSLFGEALTLDPGNSRARSGRARAATTSLGLKRTFVPDVSSAEGAEGKVKEMDDFDIDDLDVKRAAHIPGRTEIEGAPARVKPGDTYTVKIYVRNQSKKKKRIIKINELNVHRVVNGTDVTVPASPSVREVPAKARVLVATLTGPWEDDVASWVLDVRVLTEGGDVYQNRLVWK